MVTNGKLYVLQTVRISKSSVVQHSRYRFTIFDCNLILYPEHMRVFKLRGAAVKVYKDLKQYIKDACLKPTELDESGYRLVK